MNTAPWELFKKDGSKARLTDEICSAIEHGLKLFPVHSGLCHLNIHIYEMSPTPQQSTHSADVLRTRFPDQGHLLHMSSHLDVLLGDWEKAIKTNKNAVIADDK